MVVEYSLLEGLTALAAFGILMIGNEKLCELLESSVEDDNSELLKFWRNKYSARFIYLAINERIGNFYPIIGILCLTGVVGRIIIYSEVVMFNQDIYIFYILWIKLLVTFSLVLLITAPQYRLLDALGDEQIKVRGVKIGAKACCWIGYFGFFVIFMYTLDLLYLFLCFVNIIIATAVLIPLDNSPE